MLKKSIPGLLKLIFINELFQKVMASKILHVPLIVVKKRLGIKKINTSYSFSLNTGRSAIVNRERVRKIKNKGEK